MNIRSFSRLRVLLGCVVPVMFAPIMSAAAGAYEGDAWKPLDAAQEVAAAAKIDLAHYPDCDTAIVDQRNLTVVHPDGTADSQEEKFTKVLTEKGRRSQNIVRLRMYVPYSTVSVVALEVISPTGTVRPVDIAANSKEGTDDSLMRWNIYDPAARVLRVNIPNLKVGDMVHSVVRIPLVKAMVPGEYSDAVDLEGDSYIRHLLYEVRLPPGRKLARISLRHEVGHTVVASVTPEGDGLVYRWEANRVPRMFREPAMPPYLEVLQRVEFSTASDWATYSKWYWNLSQPHLEAITPEMKARVAALTAGATTDLAKVRALFFYVSKSVRYMGVTLEKDRPGAEPHDVNITFERKYGVCRDKAALLVSLLRAAHLPAYPVLISVGWKKDPTVPNAWFGHAIVAVELTPGDYTLMDPTDENTRELLPSYDTDQSYLVCRPEGETLRVSPIYPADQNRLRIATAATLSGAGRLEAKSELRFDGVNDDIFRGLFAKMKPDDRRRFFERALQVTIPGAKLTQLTITPANMLEVATPLRVEFAFSSEGMSASGQDKAVVSLPWMGQSLGVVNFILRSTTLARRKYPLKTFFACGIEENLTLTLDGHFTGAISIPSSSPVEDAGLAYRRQLNFADHTLTASKVLDLKAVEFSPRQYLELKQIMKGLAYDDRKTLIATTQSEAAVPAVAAPAAAAPAPVTTNAEMLLSDTQLTVQDAHTAFTRTRYVKKILNYAGKIKEAELKIPYNPATQDVTLVRAVVTSPAGRRQEVTKDELNVMDADWNSGAKRYTGGKILVANLPGIDVGSVIEEEYTVTTHDMPSLSGLVVFQREDQLDEKSLTITAPVGLDVHSRVFGAPSVVKSESGTAAGARHQTWRAGKVPARPDEPQLPPSWTFEPSVAYFIGDPTAYYRELNRALLDHAGRGTQAAALARRLTAATTSAPDAVRAIRDYVVKSIRPAGPGFRELPLRELSDADTTLADGYGHQADRAILLHAMLTAAGFSPDFVLASNLPPVAGIAEVAATFPMPNVFPAPLVRVVVLGETYYLNDTDEYAHLGTTPHDDRLGIVLAQAAPMTIAAAPDCRSGVASTYALSVADNGKTRITVRHQYFGSYYNQRNKYFSELTPEERRRYLQAVVTGIAQGARPIGGLTTNFDVYPGSEQYAVEVDQYAVIDGKFLYLNLPFGSPEFRPRPDLRTLPILLPRNYSQDARVEVDLPAGYRQVDIAPRTETFAEPNGSGSTRITTTNVNGKFTIAYHSEFATALLPAADYPALLEIESALKNKAGKILLLERGDPNGTAAAAFPGVASSAAAPR